MIKRIVIFLTAILLAGSLIQTTSFAQSEEDSKAAPMDEKLFGEFFELFKRFHTNAVFSGTIKTTRNGAEVTMKYTDYCRDLEHYKSETEDSAQKTVETVTPDEVWIYFPREDDLVFYKDRKTLDRRNMKKYVESFRENGKITKKVKNGETVYILSSNSDSCRVVYVFNSSGELVSARKYGTKGELESEKTFNARQQKNIEAWTFKRPYSSTTRSGDTF